MTPAADTLDVRMPHARRWVLPTAIAGVALLLFGGAAAFLWPQALARSYLFAYVFWLNVSLGAFGWLMLGHITGGAWGRTTRRACEAASLLFPILALAGMPLAQGSHWLYGWADAAVWTHDPVLQHRRPWFLEPWVTGRAVVAFAGWTLLSVWLRRLSVAQDQAVDALRVLAIGKRMRAVSQGGLVFLFLSVFLLAVDWIMALEPHWISSIFGLLILMGQACGSMAGVALVLYAVERFSGRPVVDPDQTHDLGKLLLTSLVLWAYMAFFQYLVHWMGHTQEDIRWYTRRLHGGWAWVAGALCVLHLGVPLLLLLSKPLKRSLASLAFVAGWIFVMRIVDVFWTIAPAGSNDAVGRASPFDALLWIGLGAVWLGNFVDRLAAVPLMPKAYLSSGADVSGVHIVEGAARAGG